MIEEIQEPCQPQNMHNAQSAHNAPDNSQDFARNPEAIKLLSKLNAQQKKAVTHFGQPLVVFAGAGSGKTRVITTKIAWCIKVLGLKPWSVLAVTFTNKACKEMQERVWNLVPDIDPHDLCIKTFHSFGAMVLRRFGDRIGLNSNFKIYDEDDSLALLAQIFPEEKRTDLVPISKRISLCKDRMVTPEETRNDRDASFYKHYQQYQEALLHTGNVDFADLIARTTELIDSSPDVRDWCHRRFKAVLVDEYQDSNAAQCELLKRIVGPDCSVCVVGDDDQSIYRFRGAEVRNILSFNDYFPNAKVIKLEQNYRSTSSIISLAAAIIEHNKARASKRLWTAREEGDKPHLTFVDSDFAEASYVAKILQGDGKYDSSAVLYRTNAQSAAFETMFSKMQIPYKLIGALRFYEREEVKDIVAHIALLLNPREPVSFARIINKPSRKVGGATIEKLIEASSAFNGDMIMTCRDFIKSKPSMASAGIAGFLNAYDKTLAMIGMSSNSDVIKSIITSFGLDSYYAKRDEKEENIDNKRLKNLEQVVNIISEQENYQNGVDGLNAFIEESMLDPSMMATDENRKAGGVTLITMHNTKGLEFDRVFIVGVEEGILPSMKSEGEADIEEERRIFYVAVTRARNELYILSCKQRKMWGRFQNQIPSQFLDDIPSNLINRTNSPDSPLLGASSFYRRGLPDFPSDMTGDDFGSRKRFGGYWKQPGHENHGEAVRRSPDSMHFGNGGHGSLTSGYRPYQPYQPYQPTPKPGVPSALLSRRKPPVQNEASFSTHEESKHEDAKLNSKSTEAISQGLNEHEATAQDFIQGDRIESDIYGKGEVTAVREFGKRKIYDVKFDDGRRASFVAGKAKLSKA